MSHFSWQSAMTESSLGPTVKLTLFVIGTYMNQHGTGAFPSYATIAKGTGLAKRTVQEAVKAACEAGWLVKKAQFKSGKEQASNAYSIAFPVDAGSAGAAPGVVQEVHRGSAGAAPGVVQEVHPNTPVLTPQVTQTPLSSADADGVPAAKKRNAEAARIKPESIADLFNRTCCSLPQIKGMSADRIKHFRARWLQAGKEMGRYDPKDASAGFAWWGRFFEVVEASDFLTGRKTGIRLGFDWLMKPANFLKVVEGNYDNEGAK
ncbi:helix-turn-helix domain-containing protein [Crenobacter cavernae]|uniref:Helix-turn-helix domain-containing protein n=1 Tax=Crenobacter cavernae TaxID=2290923 RepID=A0ABY0FB55_9NEIS|nr:helix-turn-helix domain-containing protein [Crenobacter cavernae]RXZ42685.1 helix-turn-helix domain-containing protein [Crenobacter cavernae]